MTVRESDDRIVPQRRADQAGREKPGNAGAGKAVGISRDLDRASTVLSDGPSMLTRPARSIGFHALDSRYVLHRGVGCHPVLNVCDASFVSAGVLIMPSEIWEPYALTAHVRIYEGPRVNAARFEYCDTTRETSGKQ